MIILGIDPGSRWTGWALIENKARQMRYLKCGSLDLSAFQQPEFQIPFEEADLVAVESAVRVYKRTEFGTNMAGNLARTEFQAGRYFKHALSLQKKAMRVEAPAVRQALTGSKSPTDAQVRVIVRIRIPNWPPRTSVHSRDGALTAIYAFERYQLDQRFNRVTYEQQEPSRSDAETATCVDVSCEAPSVDRGDRGDTGDVADSNPPRRKKSLS